MANTTLSTPPAPASAPSAGNAAGIPGYTTVWTESFDSGLGQVNHTWGHIWVHDGMATVSSWAGEQWASSGMMQTPSGAGANQGFGLYSVSMAIHSSAPGAYACLWPSSDVWPGPELDFIELDGNGNPYSTIHWKGTDGSDQYTSHALTGVDPRVQHTYSMEWAGDHISMYVDGVLKWTQTDHVPQDAAHGGENEAFGVGEQPAWAAAYQNGDNWIDVYDMSYAAPSSGGSVPSPTPAPVPTPAPTPTLPDPTPAPGPSYTYPAADDWTGIAALVTAFHDAKGWWAPFDDIVAMGWTPTGTGPTPQPPAPTPTPAPPPVVQTVGSGADSIVLKISQDAWQGSAQYTVSVDGQQVGGTLTAGASHSAGQDDTITVKGNWGAGSHQVTVTFLNDQWGGTADTDRNLYVDGIAFNGGAVGGSVAALMSNGSTSFGFSKPVPIPNATVHGTSGADWLNLNHRSWISVDGGLGADTIVLGRDHNHITILAQPGEMAGDVIKNFKAGDHLDFYGYGAGATLTSLGKGAYTITSPGHANETFIVSGYTLHGSDYTFH